MNEDLFDLPAYKLVRRNDPSTSYEAAQSIDPTKMQKVVLECLRETGPAIYDEVLVWARSMYGIESSSSVSSRFNELQKKGLIELTGQKRKGRSGRQQREWRAI